LDDANAAQPAASDMGGAADGTVSMMCDPRTEPRCPKAYRAISVQMLVNYAHT
jgi:hypothetical protein